MGIPEVYFGYLSRQISRAEPVAQVELSGHVVLRYSPEECSRISAGVQYWSSDVGTSEGRVFAPDVFIGYLSRLVSNVEQ